MCPSDDYYTRRLGGVFNGFDKRIRGLSGGPQLGNSSIEDGAIDENDGDGNLVSRIGKQDDGSHTVVSFTGPIPPEPSEPIVTPYPLAAGIVWDGVFVNSEGVPDVTIISTWDFAHVAVHLSDTPGFIHSRDNRIGELREPGGQLPVSLPAGTYYVKMVSVSQAGRTSDPTVEIEVVVPDAPDIDSVNQAIEDMEQDAAAAVAASEAAQAAAVTAQGNATTAAAAANQAVLDAQAAAAAAEAAEADAGTSAADVATAQQAAADAYAAAQDAIANAEAAELVEARAISRGTDLVTNGTGMLGTNYNFSGFVFDAADAPAGASGSFTIQSDSRGPTSFSDENIPVSTGKQYVESVYIREQNAAVAPTLGYVGLVPQDGLNRSISPQMYAYDAETETTLAAQLNPGDTTISVAAINGTWQSQSNHDYVGIWNWQDEAGKVWPIGTYTRLYPRILSISGTTITLEAPYVGPAMPVGTPVTNNLSGGTFMYVATGRANLTNQWVFHSGTVGPGVHDGTTQMAATNKFPPGTASCRLLFLPNYDGAVGSSQAYAALSLSDAAAAQQTADTALTASSAAEAAADDAAASAASSLNAAVAAGSDADAAQAAATAAQGFADTAEAAATAAGTNAANADADAAQAAADAAQAVADAAAAAASAASADAAAGNSASSATAAETAADNSAAAASASLAEAQAAGNNATAAQAAATTAQGHADDAAAAASTANSAAASADAAAAQAAADAAQAVADAAAAAQSASDAVAAATSSASSADLAQQSASKTTHIFFTSTMPAWSGAVDTAVWYKRASASEPVTEFWVWNGTAFVKQTLSETFLPLVNIGTGTVGTLSGTRIEVGTLLADRVVVGVGRNLIPNGRGEMLSDAGWATPLTFDTVDKPAGLPGSFKSTAGQGTVSGDPGGAFIVEPDTEYLFEIWIKADKPFSTFYMEFRDQSGNLGTSLVSGVSGLSNPSGGGYAVSNLVLNTTWTKYSSVLKTGASSYQLQIASLYFNHPNGTERGAVISLAGISLAPRMTGDLIVNGAIDGKTITGAFFRTVATLSRGIKINENNDNSIKMYDPITGALTFHADGDTGTVLMTSAEADGQTTELSGRGMRVLNQDGSISTQLGAFGDDFLNVTNANQETLAGISSEGVIAGKGMNIEDDPTVMGIPLLGTFGPWQSPSALSHAGWLDQMPWGIVARGYNNVSGRTVTGGYMELGEIGFDMYPGRMYRISMEPLGVYTQNSYNYLFVGETTDGSRPTQANHSQIRRYSMRNNHANSLMLPVGFTMYHYDGANTTNVGAPKRCRLLIWLQTPDATGSLTVFGSTAGGVMRVFVEDIGPFLEDTLVDRTGKSGTVEPAPEPEEKSYTKTYQATNSRSYTGNGATYNFNTSKMYQGQQPGTSNGDMQSIAVFPSMTSDLSGATITSVRAYFYFEHWYYNSGGTAKIGLHKEASLPSTQPNIYQAKSSANWPKPGGRWVDIPSSFWAEIKSGVYKGLALGEANMGVGNYGIARGNPKLEIKYKK